MSGREAEAPFITVVMPVRNEARFIEGTLRSLLEQDYPRDRFEVIVADGFSDDGTRDIVSRLAGSHPQVRLADNPGRRSSAGRNVGFRLGRGDYFLVVDGHCHIPTTGLLSELARIFRETGADCLGRPQPLDPPDLTPFQRAVAEARASRLGHGGGSLIYSGYEGYASPVSNGAAYSRRALDRVGLVDESFDACEDVEFNHRVERAGLRTYTSPALTVRYYPRESLSSLLRQMVRYGEGRCRLWRKHPSSLSATTLVPPLFAAGAAAAPVGLAASAIGALPVWLGAAPAAGLAAYALLVTAQSLALAKRLGRSAAWLPFIFPAIHAGLGAGFLRELVRGRGRAESGPARHPVGEEGGT